LTEELNLLGVQGGRLSFWWHDDGLGSAFSERLWEVIVDDDRGAEGANECKKRRFVEVRGKETDEFGNPTRWSLIWTKGEQSLSGSGGAQRK
jgi:hypothetical protein